VTRSHLWPNARQWWETTVATYVLEPHHLLLLQAAAEAWDRCQAARAQIDREGLTVAGREGGLRPHPAIAIERDSRLGFARLIRELDLDTEPPRRLRRCKKSSATWGLRSCRSPDRPSRP
jgi:phage terminase small subunit